MSFPDDASPAAVDAWIATKPEEVREDMADYYGIMSQERRVYFVARAKRLKAENMRKRVKALWVLARWMVAVRPYALFLLEYHAKMQEQKRLRLVEQALRKGLHYDPMIE